ncbi:MAG: hypothetical protein LAT55_07105 [Opitutales bacterium]|nr:hypothetical protein [Opitutales bacterium]
MNRREKTILSLVAIVAVIAVGDLFWQSVKTDSDSPAQDDQRLIEQAQIQLAHLSLPRDSRAIREAVEKPWENLPLQPFPDLAPVDPEPVPEEIQEVEGTLPRYSGFARVGSNTVAIVNNQDLREGEWLDDQSWKILEIHRTHLKVQAIDQETIFRVDLESP